MTPNQLKVLQLARRHLAATLPGFNDDMWRAILKQLGGVTDDPPSATALSNDGFTAVMEYATAHGFRSDWYQRTGGHRRGMATAKQVDLILTLWQEYSGGDDRVALDRWLDKYHHCTSLRFATPRVASGAITGLKKMVARKLAKAG